MRCLRFARRLGEIDPRGAVQFLAGDALGPLLVLAAGAYDVADVFRIAGAQRAIGVAAAKRAQVGRAVRLAGNRARAHDSPEDLVEAVARGIDMFDCVLPTRNGRTGQAFTSRGKLNIKNAQWTKDPRPLDESCNCSVCRRHSRAYLRHLYLTGEMLASILLTHHNLAFFLDTMRRVRQSIRSGVFPKFRREFTERLSANGE